MSDCPAAWERELDRIEADLTAMESLADTGVGQSLGAWDAPALQEPLPPELLPRALELSDRQQRLQERLPDLITRTRRQLEVARKVATRAGGGNPLRAAIYIDTTA